MCWRKQYSLFTTWKKLLCDICYSLFKKSCYVTKKKWTTNDICYSLFEKICYVTKKKWATTIFVLLFEKSCCYLTKEKKKKEPAKVSKRLCTWCNNADLVRKVASTKLRLLVKKNPQKNWLKQKQEVFFSFIYKKKRLANDQSSFFFFSAKRFGALERENKKASCFTKLFGFAFLFFWQFLPLGLSWAKQKTTRVFCWKQNKRKEVARFSRVLKTS